MRAVTVITLTAVCLGTMALSSCSKGVARAATTWNPKAAAGYLDQREAWWIRWPGAARDQKTFCVSCHTVLPYALARPKLTKMLGEGNSPAGEIKVLEDVRKRVRLWNKIAPYYTDQDSGANKTVESRGTEAVLNALVLANADAETGHLSSNTLAALADMWALQETEGPRRGAWRWLQFGNEPFEAHDSEYYGAALAAVATGLAPENYRSFPDIQNNVKLLREYLNRGYAGQSLINRVTALWASVELPGLLSNERQQTIIRDIFNRQRADGGWSLAPLSWSWTDWTRGSLVNLWLRSNVSPLDPKSDGYATGLIAYTLQRAGVPRDSSRLRKALEWLDQNQNGREGFWPSYSLNNRVDPCSAKGRFMSDAATGFAVLALSESTRQ
jgi:squalene-hopene/tetraprenyl-beta-curcumene cyclase